MERSFYFAFLLLPVCCSGAPVLVLQSLGWSEAEEFWTEIMQGILFDVSMDDWLQEALSSGLRPHNIGFLHFGYEEIPGTAKLMTIPRVVDTINLLENFGKHVAQLLISGAMTCFTLTVICAWGKHTSVLMVEKLEVALARLYPSIEIQLRHWSVPARQVEIQIFKDTLVNY